MKILKELINPSYVSPETEKNFKKAKIQLLEMKDIINEMKNSFSNGGSITFEQMNQYIVSTPETPLKYKTGKHCFAYRLPEPDPNKIRFYCTFEPPKGEIANYGWHNHPNCDEEIIQIIGEANSNGKIIKPFGKVTYRAGIFHDYSMKTKGSIIVTMTKVQ